MELGFEGGSRFLDAGFFVVEKVQEKSRDLGYFNLLTIKEGNVVALVKNNEKDITVITSQI